MGYDLRLFHNVTGLGEEAVRIRWVGQPVQATDTGADSSNSTIASLPQNGQGRREGVWVWVQSVMNRLAWSDG